MGKPIVKRGEFHAGADLQCGHNVVIEVAERCILGDRCTLADNTYLCGRSVSIGDDFYGYGWGHPAAGWCLSVSSDLARGWLEVGRGRLDGEDAVLVVGDRCTFHDNRIDLARRVTIGDGVLLSPEVVIYTHGYWQSMLEGYPCRHAPVAIGDGSIVGFRSCLLAGSQVGKLAVIGAQSAVTGVVPDGVVWAGNPARLIRKVQRPSEGERGELLRNLVEEYRQSCWHRGIDGFGGVEDYPWIHTAWGCSLNCETMQLQGEESEQTDDLRWFLFTRGIRFYTKRRFKKISK